VFVPPLVREFKWEKQKHAERAKSDAKIDRIEKRFVMCDLKNETLRSRLDKNSKNFSEQPSRASLRKPASRNQSFRESSGKPQGNQARNNGGSLPMASSPDRVLPTNQPPIAGLGTHHIWFPGLLPRSVKSSIFRRPRCGRWRVKGFTEGSSATRLTPACSWSM